jgi:hypothetical protein
MACVIVLAWIGQILLFFIGWKAFHWGTSSVRSMATLGLLGEIVANVVLGILLLIALSNIHSAWWLMLIVGAIIGIITGKIGAQSSGG